jgi:hypothetical protein
MLAIILSVLWITASGYPFDICWPLYCLSFELRLLITPLISVGHCIVCPLHYGFWLPLWYLLTIALSVLWITASGYPFDICWPLYCLSFELWLLITPLISVGHCIVCPLNYGFWLPLWHILTIVLSVLWITASYYPFGICWPSHCLSFELRLMVSPLISVDHCIVCPLNYGFWSPLWYLLTIVLSVLWITASDYPFDICWPLYCLSFELRLLITPLTYFDHCIVCPLNYGFWLPLWYMLAIALSVLWITASDYPFDIFWPLYCLSFELWLLITPLIYFGYCIVCPLHYGFWLLFWYILVIALSVLWITAYDYPFDIFWSLYCLSFALRLLITLLIYFGHCIVCPLNYGFCLPLWYILTNVLSVLWIMAPDYPFGICWPLYCLSFALRLLITLLIYFGHCIVCPLNYDFWLPLWYILTNVLSVLWIMAPYYPFGICWPLYCLSFALRLLITLLIYLGHCIVCPLNYGFWLPLWYMLTNVLSVLWIMAPDYPFGICWPLYCLSFELRLLITLLIYFGHCIVCPLNYGFWLPLWYILTNVLSVLWIMAPYYPFGICWPLYCLSFALRLLITLLIYLGHCIVCPLNYGFWLPLWYMLTNVLSVLWIMAPDYPFGICWPLYCLSFELRLLITLLIYFGHCIVCPLNYGFWLPLWYILTNVLSVLWIMAPDYPFGICWPLYCLSFALRLLITLLIYFGHCIVCPLHYGFWLPLWYLHTFLVYLICLTQLPDAHFEEVEFRNVISIPQYSNCGGEAIRRYPLFQGVHISRWSRRDRDRMVVGFTTTYATVSITTDVLSSNPVQERCTRYNIML